MDMTLEQRLVAANPDQYEVTMIGSCEVRRVGTQYSMTVPIGDGRTLRLVGECADGRLALAARCNPNPAYAAGCLLAEEGWAVLDDTIGGVWPRLLRASRPYSG